MYSSFFERSFLIKNANHGLVKTNFCTYFPQIIAEKYRRYSQMQVKISAGLRKSSAKISGKISQQVKTVLTRDSH